MKRENKTQIDYLSELAEYEHECYQRREKSAIAGLVIAFCLTGFLIVLTVIIFN